MVKINTMVLRCVAYTAPLIASYDLVLKNWGASITIVAKRVKVIDGKLNSVVGGE